MSGHEDLGDVGEFAALLRSLKDRTDRSYGSLARRLAMNTSTLHRYCAGDAVPVDFAPVERFAALCGATAQERLELHRRWLLAVASRRRPRREAAEGASGKEAAETTPGDEATEATPGTETAKTTLGKEAAVSTPDTEAAETPPANEAAGTTPPKTVVAVPPGTDDATAAGRGDDAAFARSPRPARSSYRRRRTAVGLAAACAVLAALGSPAALPDGRRAAADGPARTAAGGPAATGSPEGGAPARRSASPSPTPRDSRTSEPPSPSATTPGKKAAPSASARTSTPPDRGPAAAPPLTWSADSHAWKYGCGHDYVIAEPPEQVPPPPAPQDAGTWAATQSAVHGGETIVRLSVQGRTDTAVVLEALRVRVVGRQTPAGGNAYAMDQGCGGALTPRSFDVDLDKDRPLARAVAGSDAGTPIPAVSLPYRVSARDPEVLLVTARTQGCDCRWYLELDWSSQGRRGTVRVDDGGSPFRTSSLTGLPRYTYDTSARRWAPSD
ncbi:helix-turn-helix domain-containing protein [Streptomyces sp. NPDC058735]|uniref:transcriptional regulator n=1 Tax=unclassified Streptomyces TaxID=2593676 RepID=UPI00367A4F6E